MISCSGKGLLCTSVVKLCRNTGHHQLDIENGKNVEKLFWMFINRLLTG